MNKSSTLGFVRLSSGGKAGIGNDENVNPLLVLPYIRTLSTF